MAVRDAVLALLLFEFALFSKILTVILPVRGSLCAGSTSHSFALVQLVEQPLVKDSERGPQL